MSAWPCTVQAARISRGSAWAVARVRARGDGQGLRVFGPQGMKETQTMERQAGHGVSGHLGQPVGGPLVGMAGLFPGTQGVEGGRAAQGGQGDLQGVARRALGELLDQGQPSGGQAHAFGGTEMKQGSLGGLGIIAKGLHGGVAAVEMHGQLGGGHLLACGPQRLQDAPCLAVQRPAQGG